MSRGVLVTLVLFVLALPIAFFSFALLIYATPIAILVILGWQVFFGLVEVGTINRRPRAEWQGPDWWWEQAGISPTGQPLTQRATQEPP